MCRGYGGQVLRDKPTKLPTPVSPSPPPSCYFPLPSPRGRVYPTSDVVKTLRKMFG